MSSSVIEICNMALGNIRSTSINSLTESSLEAQACNLRYDQARRFMLRDHDWNFAHRVTALSLLTEEPVEWQYMYDMPNEAVRIKYLAPSAITSSSRTALYRMGVDYYDDTRTPRSIPFEMGLSEAGRKVVLTDLNEAYAAYTYDLTDSSIFDPQFVEALSWYLAALIAVPVAGAERGRDLRGEALALYSETLPAAQASDAREGYFNRASIESPTIEARK